MQIIILPLWILNIYYEVVIYKNHYYDYYDHDNYCDNNYNKKFEYLINNLKNV